MDFESPDVMKDFPGLYTSELNKTSNNDTDYSDDVGKSGKKELGKKKDKKDKKDKERGYAALEGESSAEENCEARSPSKNKKPKSFKFPSKLKEKREKSRDKEKEPADKKKEREKKTEKKVDKEKVKSDKKDRKLKSCEELNEIAENLPVFGVSLEHAVKRSRCHDGIDIPLPVRNCIDYVQSSGLHFEGVYKVSVPKSKVVHLKKLYNHREIVVLAEYDVPTVTSLLKVYLRDLPEPVFTGELLVRFEEAGAILNVAMREKHLKILVNNLPAHNRLLLSWIIVHLYNVTLNEKYNKMNAQNIAVALSPALQTSHRLLMALLCHCLALFPNLELIPYVPPLTTAQLPDEPKFMEIELTKQESLLSQIHFEMNAGFISKQREELLWEVQRIITQLKRKLKIAYKDKETVEKVSDENLNKDVGKVNIGATENTDGDSKPIGSSPTVMEAEVPQLPSEVAEVKDFESGHSESDQTSHVSPSIEAPNDVKETIKEDLEQIPPLDETSKEPQDKAVMLMQLKNSCLLELKESLLKEIDIEKSKIFSLNNQLMDPSMLSTTPAFNDSNSASLDEVMDLLHKENQILQITKINLVRQIMEQQEICIDLKAKLGVLLKN